MSENQILHIFTDIHKVRTAPAIASRRYTSVDSSDTEFEAQPALLPAELRPTHSDADCSGAAISAMCCNIARNVMQVAGERQEQEPSRDF